MARTQASVCVIRTLHLGDQWPTDQPGGMPRYLAELRAALADEGALARVVVVGAATDAPVGTVRVSSTNSPIGWRMLRTWWCSQRLTDVDLVDVHFAPYGLLPLLFGRLRKKQVVVHFQGPWAEEGKLEGGSRLRRAAKRSIELAVYRRADRVVVLTDAFARVVTDDYGVDPGKVIVRSPGIDLEKFRPIDRAAPRRRLGLPESDPVVLCARRLALRMGIHVLLDAWPEVRAAVPGALLVIIGDGPERTRLEAQARAVGASDAVRFLGRVSDDDLVAAYQAADLSVVPSVALEGFGLVVLESLACGTPVVGTDAAGLREAIGAFDSSLVVPAGDRAALARKLSELLANPDTRPSMERCRAHAERHGWQGVARWHLELYTELASRRRHVTFVDHTAKLGGGEIALARLVGALEELDWDVVLGEDGPLLDRIDKEHVSVLPLGKAGTVPRDRMALLSRPRVVAEAGLFVLRLARHLRRTRSDLVHTNSLKANLLGGIGARLSGVPVVWHVRDMVTADYLGERSARMVGLIARWLPNAVIANSEATLATLGPLRRPAFVLPSPVPVDAFHTERPRRPDGVIRVGICGRLAPWKGQDVFLRAFAEAFPDRLSVVATVIGAPLFGEDAYEASLHQLAVGLGITHRVEFRGFREDVAAELARLDVLVHASVLPEPFGLVIVEGLASGLPVIAARAGGPMEILEDNKTGWLVPPGAVGELSRRLRDIVELDQQIDSDAFRDVARRYDARTIAKIYERWVVNTLQTYER